MKAYRIFGLVGAVGFILAVSACAPTFKTTTVLSEAGQAFTIYNK